MQSPFERCEQKLMNRMLGPANETKVKVCEVETNALIDSGSMITCMSEDFYESLEPQPQLKQIQDFKLNIYGAGGDVLPFLGYVDVPLRVDCIADSDLYVPMLVAPTTDYTCSKRVPIIVGTNVIRLFKAYLENIESVSELLPEAWQVALDTFCVNTVPVKATNRYPLTIGPFETKVITGLARKQGTLDTVVTEQKDTSQAGGL